MEKVIKKLTRKINGKETKYRKLRKIQFCVNDAVDGWRRFKVYFYLFENNYK